MKKKTKLFLTSSLMSIAPLAGITYYSVEQIQETKQETTTATLNAVTSNGGNYTWLVIVIAVSLIIIAIVVITLIIVLQSRKNRKHKEEVDTIYLALTEPEPYIGALPYKNVQPLRLSAPDQNMSQSRLLPSTSTPVTPPVQNNVTPPSTSVVPPPTQDRPNNQIVTPTSSTSETTEVGPNGEIITTTKTVSTSSVPPPPPPKIELNSPKSLAPKKNTK